MSAAAPPRVILIGPMGAGKSTVAAHLADHWQGAMVDTDDLVATRAGRSIGDIFIDEGEGAFRELERTAVAESLTGGAVVIALGGGAVLDAQTQSDLLAAAAAGTHIVFLDLDAATASKRVGLGVGRPLLLGNPRATWVKLLAQRRSTYQRLATVVIDTANRTPGEIADEIIAAGETS